VFFMRARRSPSQLLSALGPGIPSMSPWRPNVSPERSGFTILEPLIVSVIVVLVISGSAALMVIANRRFVSSQQRIEMNRQIDTHLQLIGDLARKYTCCSGICTVTPPLPANTQTGTGGAVTKSCVTVDWRSRNYYFPARDDPTTTANITGTSPGTPSEMNAVDQICQTARNTDFMTPFRTAVTSATIPAGANWSVATTIQSEKTLRIVYTDTINNVEARRSYITPAMAKNCSASN